MLEAILGLHLSSISVIVELVVILKLQSRRQNSIFSAWVLYLLSLLVCFFSLNYWLTVYQQSVVTLCNCLYILLVIFFRNSQRISRYDEQEKSHFCQSCQEWGIPSFLGCKVRVRTA
jgi:Ca2+/Na+ antiporter